MKKLVIFMMSLIMFACDPKKEEPTTALPVTDSTAYSYDELKQILIVTEALLKANPDLQLPGVDKKFDGGQVLAGLSQLVNLLDGLKKQSNTPIQILGTAIPETEKEGNNSFEKGITALKKDKGLWPLYQRGNIRAFEITKQDIDTLTGMDSSYHSIRAYPMLHPDGTALTYAFVVVKKGNSVTGTNKEAYEMNEYTKNMRDIWDPWPPKKGVLTIQDSVSVSQNTLLKYYKY